MSKIALKLVEEMQLSWDYGQGFHTYSMYWKRGISIILTVCTEKRAVEIIHTVRDICSIYVCLQCMKTYRIKYSCLQPFYFNDLYIMRCSRNQIIELVFICIPAKKWYRRYRAVPGYILIRFMCPPFSPNYFLLLFFVVFVIFDFFF